MITEANQTANTTLSGNALQVLQSRYLRCNEKGETIESPDDLFHRVAKAIASAELKWGTEADAQKWESTFYHMLRTLLFLPNSPTMMNAGTPLNQLSACFVLPVEDNIDSIFTTLKQAALIQQSGGGTGFNFSHLRPKNDLITKTGGTASGPASFMKIFNAATEYIKLGGKRRGANMGILNIDHPDIEEFIDAKSEEGVLNNFNISVGITDAFMQAVEKNESWNLIHPNTKAIVKTVAAKALWDSMIQNAWRQGDPGVVFLDTINAYNTLAALGAIECTNPCGEVPLLPYESCNLGSLNLSRFVVIQNGHPAVDWALLEETVHNATRFLDNVIEVNNYLFPEIQTVVQSNRKIGLGVMGWAELLIHLGIPYDSEAAIQLAHRLMEFIDERSKMASMQLAAERGAFTHWEQSIFYPIQPIRNATRLSIAPTGTISIIGGTSSSIEPLFAIAYTRRHVLNEKELSELNPLFVHYLKEHGLYSEALIGAVKATGSVQDLKALPANIKALFKTALEISPEWHLRHQVAFQQHVDNAVSKTINLPQTATIADVDRIYKMAWQQKAKGITIFRYHSKSRQVLESGITSDVKACKVCVG